VENEISYTPRAHWPFGQGFSVSKHAPLAWLGQHACFWPEPGSLVQIAGALATACKPAFDFRWEITI
jgi:hypothetical protein